MMNYYNIKNKKSKKYIVVLSALALLSIIGSFTYQYIASNNVTKKNDISNTNDINLSPPTKDEILEAERNKQRLIEEGQSNDSDISDNDKQSATPVFGYLQQTDARDIEANGYISEAIETDGTCTLVLNKEDQEVSSSRQAMPDAQSTVCGQLVIERSKLSAGKWKAKLIYNSSRFHGSSEERTLQVE